MLKGLSTTKQRRFKENDNNNIVRNATNRYRNAVRGSDMKRARSVEAISRTLFDDNHHHHYHVPDNKSKRESMHEGMLLIRSPEPSDQRNGNVVDKGNNKVFNANPVITQRVNRPKRIQAVVSEKDRPPVDVVKQTKRMFEGKPEQRTRQPHLTGEVAAKVATYKNIIVQSKVNNNASNKKPPIKQKPALIVPPKEKPSKLAINTLENNGWISSSKPKTTSPDVAPLTSPVPDISRVTSPYRSESAGQMQNGSSLCETPDLILHSSPSKVLSPTSRILATDDFLRAEINHSIKTEFVSHKPPSKGSSNHAHSNNLSQPLKLNSSRTATDECGSLPFSSLIKDSGPLTPQELEKNLINSAKTLEQHLVVAISPKCVEEVKTVEVVAKPRRMHREVDQNSVVFKFTDRKDVPDYVCNDGIVRTGKLEKPKVSSIHCTFCKSNFSLDAKARRKYLSLFIEFSLSL